VAERLGGGLQSRFTGVRIPSRAGGLFQQLLAQQHHSPEPYLSLLLITDSPLSLQSPLAGSSTTMPNSLTSWSLIRGSSAYSETTYVPTSLASVPSMSRLLRHHQLCTPSPTLPRSYTSRLWCRPATLDVFQLLLNADRDEDLRQIRFVTGVNSRATRSSAASPYFILTLTLTPMGPHP
jgi:hypothetical protein